MALRLLVALDGSEQSMRAVHHVKKIVSEGCDCYVTLLHVAAIPPELLEHQGSEDPDRERQLQRNLKERREAWQGETRKEIESKIFEPAREVLVDGSNGSGSARVFSKLEFEPHHRVASSILWETERGGYDAVVVGRHGHSHIRDFLLGSVSSKVIHHLKHCSIWVAE